MKGKNLENDSGGLDFGGQGPHGDPLWAGSCQWQLVFLIKRGMTSRQKWLHPDEIIFLLVVIQGVPEKTLL